MPVQLDVEDDVVLLVPEVETVPEHDVHRVLVDLLAAGLAARFADADDVAVFCRLAWFPDRSDTRIRLDPDVMVVRGRPPGPRKSYKAWMEDGVPPAVVVEVWSDDDTDAAYRRRLARMRRYGVQEVVIVDPFAPGGVRVDHLQPDPGDATGFRVVATSVQPDNPVQVASLGIRLAGGPELDVRDNGERWSTTAETVLRARAEAARADHEARRADQERQRAEQERQRAEQERQRAEHEKQRAEHEKQRAEHEKQRAEHEKQRAEHEKERAERLAAQLRAAGIDPDA